MLFLILCAMLLPYALPDLCGNDELVETVSPNGKLKAVSFRRSCGATTGYSTHVAILPAAKRLPNEPGNTFVADDEVTVIARWLDDQQLIISGGATGAIRREASVRRFQIVYE